MNPFTPRSEHALAPRRWLLPLVFAALVTLPSPVPAATQTQTLNLAVGWNAIWLEVEPTDTNGRRLSVDQVFQSADFTIDVVARPFDPVGTAEFVANPSDTFNQPAWLVWYANPVAGGNDVFPVTGNQAYLLHVASSQSNQDGNPAGSLVVGGAVRFFQPTWTPGAFNLLGFPVLGALTFADYLSSLSPKNPSASGDGTIPTVQRLDPTTGGWLPVDLQQPITAGQAYWVWAPFSLKTSRYGGPVSVLPDGTSRLDFGPGPGAIEVPDPASTSNGKLLLTPKEITLSNIDPSIEASITLSKVSPDDDDLRLFALRPDPATLDWRILPGTGGNPVTSWNAGALPAETSRTLTLGADRNWTEGAGDRENLYQLLVSLPSGSYYLWLPVVARRTDLTLVPDSGDGSPNAAYAGLWVGRVVLDTVTSLAESGAPARPTTSTVPLQVLIHFDGTNAPTLLSHVMFLQTKSADPSVPPTPILLVDESKIPFFEGVAMRGGRRVGRRLETVAYDLPRKMDPTTQSALATQQGLTTAAAITSYVNGQTERPPALEEAYHLTWPLAGTLAPGRTLRTPSTTAGDAADLPLTLDPFHRSNPFTHAFHPRHGAGYPVSRAIAITFENSSDDGLLRGTYTELLSGLVASARPLSLSGKITLQRASTLANLQ